MLKILQARLQQYVNHEHPDVQAGFRKGRGTRDPLPTSAESLQKQDSSSDFIDYTKDSEYMYHNKLCKILQEMGIPDHVTCLLRNLYAGQKATEPNMEQQTGSKLGKEYFNALYCHPDYLTYMQRTSCKMLG